MKNEDAERLTVLWMKHQPMLAAFVRTLLRNADHAEEVLQRVGVALVRKFDQYDQERPFGPWAVGVAKYEVLAFRRERAADRHVFADELIPLIADEFKKLTLTVPTTHAALDDCLQKMAGRSRQALEMSYGRNMKSNDVARELGLSSSGVRMLLYRAREALRACIERQVQAGERSS